MPLIGVRLSNFETLGMYLPNWKLSNYKTVSNITDIKYSFMLF